MYLIDFNNAKQNIRTYSGNAGIKYGLKWNDENWIVKYPKNTKNFVNPKISYTTSLLNEYLGSKIYKLLDIPVHDVLLGYRKSDFSKTNKLVVFPKEQKKFYLKLIELRVNDIIIPTFNCLNNL